MLSFSAKQYLESMGNMEEMRVKENAPLFSRPSSPQRKVTMTLEDIPEATPGPNAFAQQAARMDKHRLDGNAFYQQEVQKRKVTPPSGVHPALRVRSISEPPSPPRESCTTMSPFTNAGEMKQESPPLKLVPSEAHMAEPTRRGHIEERREQFLHEQSGSEEERTPVFVPTPKLIASADFGKPSATPKKRVEKEITFVEPAKTPKRGFLERLRITTNLRGTPSPSMSTLNSMHEGEFDQAVPVKAQAVLGTSPSKGRTSLGSLPSKTNIPRSPSKRKGLFSRKNSGFTDMTPSKASLATSAVSEHPPPTDSTITKTPQTAISDPTHYSYQSKRTTSQTHSDKGGPREKAVNKCMIARSQSLKYFDHGAPPTPPAKNTPPNEKARREAALATKSSRLPFHDEQTTPSNASEGVVSTSERLSPTRFGSYGHRETPTLITKPSLYSLHASVVPNLNEASTFEQMRARIDGLGLEGFNTPQENFRSPKVGTMYTPSIYSTDWVARPSPSIRQVTRQSQSTSSHTKGSSSGGEIPVFYPDLANDPSFSNISRLLDTNNIAQRSASQNLELLNANQPWHGRTHARDHSNNPRHSVDPTIFAQHVDDELNEPFYDSPTSFSHPSATPSPLHALSDSVYTPPPRKSSKRNGKSDRLDVRHGQTDAASRKGLVIQGHSRSKSTSPSRSNDLFENVPTLPAQTSRINRSPSPPCSLRGTALNASVDVDPQKPSPAKSPSGDKLDRMIEILNKLGARNNEVRDMRDEMRASNARIDERLAAVENLKGSSLPPSYASDESSGAETAMQNSDRQRVPTLVAHEYYRNAQVAETAEDEGTAAIEPTEASTMAELVETNRRLLEMVGGFAEKIQALEKKVGGGT